MSKPRTERHLSIWRKVEECERALGKINEADRKVDQLIKVEKLMVLKKKITNV